MGPRVAQIHVGLVIGVDRANVAPVAQVDLGVALNAIGHEVIGVDRNAFNQARDEIAAKVVMARRRGRILDQRATQQVGIEKVVTHRGETLPGSTRHRTGRGRLLLEAGYAKPRIDLDDAKLVGFLDRHRDGRDGHGGFALEMELDHLLHVHPVDMVRAEDRNEIRVVILEQVEVLKDGVGGALVPALAHPHLGRNGSDKLVVQYSAELPSVLEVLDQRLGAPLNQDVNRVNSRIY